MKSKRWIILTGGLGNQLFQMAAGLNSTTERVCLESKIGNPRKNNHGEAELLSFRIPERTSIINSNAIHRGLFSKVFGFLLRSGIEPNKIERFLPIRKLINLVGALILSVALKARIRVFQCENIGYCEIPRDEKNWLIIGYLQSYQWLSPTVQSEMKKMNLCETSEALEHLIAISEVEKPIVVHIRLGDYLDEPHFGIPGKKYYETALDLLTSQFPKSKIWLFSNNFVQAKLFIPDRYTAKLRVMDYPELSSAGTLELMKLGHAYVLGNSTFSWWAAQLSKNETAPVIAPQPWFRMLPEPSLLIPDHWLRISASWVKLDGSIFR